MSTAERMMQLFGGFAGAHGTFGRPVRAPGELKATIRDTARTVREPVTAETWVKHLDGERPLGVIPIREDGTCSWGGIDHDVYDADLVEIIARVRAKKFPLVPCRSKSGGLHLWLFLIAPAAAADVLAALREMAAQIGLAGSEIFPKQTQVIAGRGDTGNWIAMPYLGTTFDGLASEQCGLEDDGASMPIDKFLLVAESTRAAASVLSELIERRTRPTGKGRSASTAAASGGRFSDGPPCLETLAGQGFPQGNRNRALFMIGVYARRREPTNWRQHVEQANRDLMRPPLTAAEVTEIVKSLQKREYRYTCKQDPMASFCNVAVCRTRQHGIGDEGNTPRISGISYLDTDPPLWFVNVDDQRVELKTDELMSYEGFNRVCLARLKKLYLAMKQSDWLAALSPLLKHATPIDAPPDVGRTDHFRELLEDFLTRGAGSDPEDALRGRPWLDEERALYYFKLRDLENFCKAEKFFDLGRIQMNQRLSEMGAGYKKMRIKGSQRDIRSLPSAMFPRGEALSLPAKPRSPM